MSSGSEAKFSPTAVDCISPISSPLSQPCVEKLSSPSSSPQLEVEGLVSPIRPISSPVNELPFQEYEDKENTSEKDSIENRIRFCSTPSPLRCHNVGSDGMRQHLLVQRTFNIQEDSVSPLTSSPMRKFSSSASPCFTPNRLAVHRNINGADSYTNGCSSQPIFKTPVRGQNSSDRDHTWERTPSASRTPGIVSPGASLYAFTPGRQFVNPFEMDHERLHHPALTPGMLQFKQKGVDSSAETEGFWTVEQRALMMPIEIKESEVLRQYFYQKQRDQEMDPNTQKAIDHYFSNNLIVPSPWSEKVTRAIPQTPKGIKSVSCQTNMSIPPHVDFLAEIGEKYQLPDNQLVQESPVDSLAGSFIRRKLLHQLNKNDDDSFSIGASPVLPNKSNNHQNLCSSSSPSPSTSKQVTPELDKQTPNKKSSGHFSSSPIQPQGEKGNHPAMSESDLLASPELSPIAGRGSNRQLRSSDVFTPHAEFERSREIMQLDFSSILDEPDEFDAQHLTEDKTRTLIDTKGISQALSDTVHNASPELQQNTHSAYNLSHVITEDQSSSNKSSSGLQKSLLMSGLSVESTQDIAVNQAHLLSCQDTGYHTTSLQSITNLDSACSSVPHQHDIFSTASSANHSFSSFTKTAPASFPSDLDLSCRNGNPCHHTSFTNQQPASQPLLSELCMEENGNSLDSYLSSGYRSSAQFSDNSSSSNTHKVCKVRKVRTLADIRRSKEKSNASRDLTSSFNEEAKSSSTTVVRLSRSLSNPSFDMDSSSQAFDPQQESKSELECTKFAEMSVQKAGSAEHFCLKNENSKVSDLILSPGVASSGRTVPYLEKRPFENLGNKSDISLEETQNEHKHIKLTDVSHSHKQSEVEDFPNQLGTKFSLEDKSALNEARELLEKSEALRRQHTEQRGKNQTGVEDKFLQYISGIEDKTRVEELGQLANTDSDNWKKVAKQATQFDKHPAEISTSDGSLFDSMEEKIKSIESVKLGSEIAAEILKRAGDDLAQLI